MLNRAPSQSPLQPEAQPRIPSMTVQRQSSVEKSVVDEKEKSSVDMKDSGSAQGELQSPALSYKPGSPSKPKLPYSWQLVMIVLTCLCTCTFLFYYC